MVAKNLISRMISGLFVTLFILSATPFQSVRAGGIRYVKPDVSGNGNCSGWDNACTLQTALTGVIDGDEIWAAAGKYKPTTDPTDRTATFLLINGVAVYGGFAGTETGRDQRDFALNITILSGDLNGDDNDNVAYDEPTREDNSYHVVTGATGATLDGFTIMAGNAYDYSSGPDSGGGMYNNSSSPILANIVFSKNLAQVGGGMYNNSSSPKLADIVFSKNSAQGGGGMYNNSSSPTLTNVTFSANTATYGCGGGMENNNSSPTLTKVSFSANSATNASGGGMDNDTSNPTLTNVTFNDNSAYVVGAGMSNQTSSPTLTNVTFSGNSAPWGGGGMANIDSSPLLTNITFIGNTAGGLLNAEGSHPTLIGVVFDGNSSTFKGGGMFNFVGGNPTLTNVTFSGNTAENGGGIYNQESSPILANVTFSGNSATEDGGGIYNDYSSPKLTEVVFNGNSADHGGGIYNSPTDTGNPTFANVTFIGNSATEEGGGMYNFSSCPTLTEATFKNNSAPLGGGMYNYDCEDGFMLTNVTFSNNSATSNGGGMYNESSYAKLTNVTFNNNIATFYGGGMYNHYVIADIRNTIFWGNTASSGGAQISNSDENELNMSYSVLQDGGVDGTNIITADPKLGPLGNYGGFTQTIPLLIGSSAIDAGDDTACPPTDQRGVARPQGARCDIGAFEAIIYSIYLPLVLR